MVDVTRPPGARSIPTPLWLSAAALALAAVLLTVGPAAAQDAVLDVRIGFAGAVRVGVPVPVRIALSSLPVGGRATLVIDAPGMGPQEGPVVETTVVPFEAVAGTLQSFDVPVVLSNIRRPVTVRVAVSGREIVRRSVAIAPSLVGGRVVVALSDEHAGLESLSDLDRRVVSVYVDADGLPHRWQEYSAVDLVILRDLDPGRLDNEQREALTTWVRLGGRLMTVARPGVEVGAFLDRLLPSDAGGVRTLSVGSAPGPADAAWPPGRYAARVLAPRPGAAVVRLGGVPVIAKSRVGSGWSEEWGVDPWQPPLAAWPGRRALLVEALGQPAHPLVNIDAVADVLPAGTPIGPGIHALTGGAIVAYLGVLYLIARRVPARWRTFASIGVVVIGAGAFWWLADAVRGRSTSVAQVTFFEPAPGMDVSRALTVGVVSVPYGGSYRAHAVPEDVVGPVAASGDLRTTVTDAGTMLEGTLPPQGQNRAFQALAAVQLSARAEMDPDGRTLTVDVGPERVRRAELRWRDRTYWLGDVAPGVSTRTLNPSAWIPLSDIDSSLPGRSWIFLGPTGDAIMKPTTPVLVGEIPHTVPVFGLMDGGTVNDRPAILLLRVAGH